MGRPAQFLGTLAAALGLVAACLAPLASRRFGGDGLAAVGLIAIACFVPGVVLAMVAGRVTGSQRSLFLLLVGTGLRVGLVLAAALVVVQLRPALKSTEFYLGLAVLYCVALAIETRQLLAEVGPSSSRQPQST
jgi:hypothetical protein